MSKFYITNGVTQDGFGARLQRCLQVINFVCMLRQSGINVEYIHTPFSYNENNTINDDRSKGVSIRQNFTLANAYPYNDISEEGYEIRSKLWDNALSFNKKTVYDLDVSLYNIKQGFDTLNTDISNHNTNNSLYVIRYLHQEYDYGRLDLNTFHYNRDYILDCFDFKKNYTNVTQKQIAIHIRRKDSIDKSYRCLNDDHYLSILSNLNAISKSHNIVIYTQEVGFNKDKYAGYNISYDSVDDDFEVFNKFVTADHLIVGTSSFSYAAALLNRNLVVYHFHGQHHAAMSTWINIDQYKRILKNYYE